MYIINKLQFHFLFVVQWTIRFGLAVFVSYPCTSLPPPPTSRSVHCTCYFPLQSAMANIGHVVSCHTTLGSISLVSIRRERYWGRPIHTRTCAAAVPTVMMIYKAVYGTRIFTLEVTWVLRNFISLSASITRYMQTAGRVCDVMQEAFLHSSLR
jgi:hypothetical protein